MGQHFNLLHITDLHANRERSAKKTLAEWDTLLARLMERGTGIAAIAVTGDLTSHADPEEFALAKELLEKALACCGLDHGHIFFCQGNHDADTPYPGSSFAHYQEFLDRFLPERRQGTCCPDLPGVSFTCLNTNSRTGLWEKQDNAWLLEKECETVWENPGDDTFRVVLMHHEPEVIKNQALLQKVCIRADLVLCGHLHPNRIVMQKIGRAEVVTGLAVNPRPNEVSMGLNVISVSENRVQAEPIYLLCREA